MKKQFTIAVLALFSLGRVYAQKSSIYIADGKAIKGYDPVAFFTESRAVMGQDSLKTMWQGASWCFASRKDLETFTANPGRYAPQYGGYCAYGTAQGHKAPTQVETWSVVDGKLYFNYNLTVKEAWSKDRAGMIQKADANWPGLKDKE